MMLFGRWIQRGRKRKARKQCAENRASRFYGLRMAEVKLSRCERRCGKLPFQVFRLVLDAFPLIGIGRRGLSFDDRLPNLRELGIERCEGLLIGGNIILGKDGLDRTLGHAERAIDALIGIDDEKIRALPEAVDRAHVDAVGILAADAALGDDVGHARRPARKGLILANPAVFSDPARAKFSVAYRCALARPRSFGYRILIVLRMPATGSVVRTLFPLSCFHGRSPAPHEELMSDQIKHVSDATFDKEVLQSATPVLVDYWAEWCGPCKMIAPVLEDMAKEYAGRLTVAKLDIDANPG